MSSRSKKSNNSPRNNERFEDYIDVITAEIRKRRGSWHLNALAWMDFDDVSQIIMTHVFEKWWMWDSSRPLKPWLNTLISNQFKNILRNNYGNFARPCLNCPFNQGSTGGDGTQELCGYTKSGVQCAECPVYSKWEKTKKAAHDVKLPVTIENHTQEVHNQQCRFFEQEGAIQKIAEELKTVLTEKQYIVFQMKYIENHTDEEISKRLGYKTTEKKRMAGYRQIKNIQRVIKDQTKKILETKDIL